MDQDQRYVHAYVLQPPLSIPSRGVPQITGMQPYAPPPSFPCHAQQYSYPAGPARSAAIPSAAITPQGTGLGLVSGFFSPWEPPPAPVQPPVDNDLQKRIEKLVEYAYKNGPQFESLMKDKQKENPLYAFLFGAEGNDYYRYKLWQTLSSVVSNPPPASVPSYNPGLAALNAAQNASLAPGIAVLNSLNPAIVSQLKPALSAAPPVGPPNLSFGSKYFEQPNHLQPFYDQFQHGSYSGGNYQQASVVPTSGPLPLEIAAALKRLLDNLTGTTESIKGAKLWFMQRAAYGPALVEVLKDRVLSMDDVERQLHIIYLANDILFNSVQHRTNLKELDPEALAFKPALGTMLAAIYHNPKDMAMNQDRLQKILQFWGAKDVYDTDTINTLEGEMVAGPPPPVAPAMKLPSAVQFQYGSQWQPDEGSQPSSTGPPQLTDRLQQPFPAPSQFYGEAFSGPLSQFNPSNPSQQFLATSVPSIYPSMAGLAFLAPLPAPVPIQTPPLAALPTPVRPADQNAYPHFPPGLVPGMVRKMQIGSGVPYSPLSPLDIPTVIPPSTASDSYILERVAKFFKEIGEVDPLEGQVTANDATNHDEEGGRGGARVPPPNSMQIDSETSIMPDGSLEHRPGMARSGRLGLGASADLNGASQYDDVYSSYRKQRSTNYHTTLSARAAAR